MSGCDEVEITFARMAMQHYPKPRGRVGWVGVMAGGLACDSRTYWTNTGAVDRRVVGWV
jgi:hypothetical protein